MHSTDSTARLLRNFAFPLLLLIPFAACEPEAPEAAEPDRNLELGTVDFPTSCEEPVQAELERGLALLHHMMYVESEAVFERAALTREDCAIAHWGVAMTQFQPLWPGEPRAADLEKGRHAAQEALRLAPTDRERAYAEAAAAFYEGIEAPYRVRLENWEAAMAELHAAYPEDPEAATLYALAHLSLAPADPDRQERALALLEVVHEEMPRHPGAIHYAIHIHDVEARAEDGVSWAEAYEDIAPTVPHSLHMPSHIYVRTGNWDQVIEWNRRSADAALDHPAGEHVSHHHPHALDYLMYGHLQRGEDEEARAVLEELRAYGPYQPTFISAYALAAIPARWHVERRDWEGARDLEPRDPAAFPWEDFPGAEAMTHFARGLGAARTGDPEGARASTATLEELEAAARDVNDDYWARQIRVQRDAVSAWTALAEGRADEAVEEMSAAAGLEAAMEKHPVTPGALQPAFELLGELLLEADRPEEALAAFERTLGTWPDRYHSLLGAARAADRLGDDATAERYYGELVELTADAPADREGIAEARDRTADR